VSEHPTLHAWAGGDTAFRRLIDAFYDRVERDDLLRGFFPNGVGEEHRTNLTHWWIEVFGGPTTCTDHLGGTNACSVTTAIWRSRWNSASGSRAS
jgi:hemoglobin